MIWYILGGLAGIIFFKKKYNLTFWQAVGNGIILAFVIYFGVGWITGIISLIIGTEEIPVWAPFLYALLTIGGILKLSSLKKQNKLSTADASLHKSNQEFNKTLDEKKYKPGDFIETSVAGVTFEGRQKTIKKLSIGDEVSLIREPNNEHDFNAIQIFAKNRESIGYIHRDLSEKIAPIIDHSFYPNNIKGEIISLHQVKNNSSIIGVRIKFQLSVVEDLNLPIEKSKPSNIIEISFPKCPKCGQNDKVARVKDILSFKKDSPILISKLSPPRFEELQPPKLKEIPEILLPQKPKPLPVPEEPEQSVYWRLFIVIFGLIIFSWIILIPIKVQTNTILKIPVTILSIFTFLNFIFLILDFKKRPELKKEFLQERESSIRINESKLDTWNEIVNSRRGKYLQNKEQLLKENQILQEEYDNEKNFREQMLNYWDKLYYCYRDDSIFFPDDVRYDHVDKIHDFIKTHIYSLSNKKPS